MRFTEISSSCFEVFEGFEWLEGFAQFLSIIKVRLHRHGSGVGRRDVHAPSSCAQVPEGGVLGPSAVAS